MHPSKEDHNKPVFSPSSPQHPQYPLPQHHHYPSLNQFQSTGFPFPPPSPLHFHHGSHDGQIIQANQCTTYSHEEHPWSSGLFDCQDDVRNCCNTLFCPCWVFGQISEIINEGQTPWLETGLVCGILAAFGLPLGIPIFILHTSCPYSCWYRAKMRKKFKLSGNCASDCAIHAFCECCAICQEYRELDHQGYDVPVGWHENYERQRQAVAVYRVVPVIEQGMRR